MGSWSVLLKQPNNVISLPSSILLTLLYADIFHYPYTFDELVSWLPYRAVSQKKVQACIAVLQKRKKISVQVPYIALYGHEEVIQKRERGEKYASLKWKKARFASHILRCIPSILFIGVSGGLAVNNVERTDDIDFFICTKNKTIWSTRFLATIILDCFGLRRHPKRADVKDMICMNMFISERSMPIPTKERDIYSAHEVLQMVLLWERNHTYQLFLKKNKWVSHFFPGKWKELTEYYRRKWIHHHSDPPEHGEGTNWDSVINTVKRKITSGFVCLFRFFEQPIREIQQWYMEKRITSEIVSDSIIRFHPSDAHIWVRGVFEKKMKQYHLPLDKNFFHP